VTVTPTVVMHRKQSRSDGAPIARVATRKVRTDRPGPPRNASRV
jgi:hypothetical protein